MVVMGTDIVSMPDENTPLLNKMPRTMLISSRNDGHKPGEFPPENKM
jgi:hypothetical protein